MKVSQLHDCWSIQTSAPTGKLVALCFAQELSWKRNKAEEQTFFANIYQRRHKQPIFCLVPRNSPGIRTFWGRLNKNKNFKINQPFFDLLSWVLLSTESLFFWVVVFEAVVSPGSSVLCHSIFCLCCLTASWTLSSIISSVRTPSGEPYALAWN